MIYWLTKYPLTPLHKDAVIGRLKRCDHFRRGSLTTPLYMIMMYGHCNSENKNGMLILNPPIEFRLGLIHILLLSIISEYPLPALISREYFNGTLNLMNC